ncbi:MAG: alpha-ribazole phosphatase family protein, partial [Odoribacter sp.]|nr:alpha-ribazole phosphatase family protein [Odoribacter sp.]
MKITLIRHTSVAVEPGICYGWSDVNVATSFETEASRVKAALAGKSFDIAYSSPLSRCHKLANFCGFPHPIVDERLKELNFGKWEMQKWDDITDPALQRWYDDWIHTPAGGAESYEDQCARVAAFLRELLHSGHAHPCIFTHRGVIA